MFVKLIRKNTCGYWTDMIYFIKTFLYRLKNSNITISIDFNPTLWTLLPYAITIPSYADSWLCDDTMLKYKMKWLLVSVYIELETSKPKLPDTLTDYVNFV